jgi:hypothetical protein
MKWKLIECPMKTMSSPHLINLALAAIASLIAATQELPAEGGEKTTNDWPQGYELDEETQSPDGHYGVLMPTDFNPGERIALVEIKTHRRLCFIEGAPELYGYRKVAWAEDSSWCVVSVSWRDEFFNVTLVEIHGTTCKQTDLENHIRKSLNNMSGVVYFRPGPGHSILFRAFANEDPHGRDPDHTDDPFFQGTFDRATKKWTRSISRRVPNIDAMKFACEDTFDEGPTLFDEAVLKGFDERLNEVYAAVRIILPAERFAAVKKEQIQWLKKLEAADSIGKKGELMAARIKELRRLVWE